MFSLYACRGYDIYMVVPAASITVAIDNTFVFLVVGSNVQEESIDNRDESVEVTEEQAVLEDHDESDTDACIDGILDEKETVLGCLLSPSSTFCGGGNTAVSGKGSDLSSLSCLDHDDECESSQLCCCSSNEK